MFSWFKRDSAAPAPITSGPWANPVLRAEVVDVPWGKSGSRTVRLVQLTVAGAQVTLHPGDLRHLIKGRTNMVDSMPGSDAAFLVQAGIDLKGTDAYPWTSKLPDGSLVLLREPMTEPPLAVLSGADAKGFLAWVQGLPR